MRPDYAGPERGPEAPFPIELRGPVIKGFGRGSKEVGLVVVVVVFLVCVGFGCGVVVLARGGELHDRSDGHLRCVGSVLACRARERERKGSLLVGW